MSDDVIIVLIMAFIWIAFCCQRSIPFLVGVRWLLMFISFLFIFTPNSIHFDEWLFIWSPCYIVPLLRTAFIWLAGKITEKILNLRN